MSAKKYCCRCEQDKPASDFTKDTRRKDGLRSYCKACERSSKATQRTTRAAAVQASNQRYWKANARRINTRRRIRYAIAIHAGQWPAWRIGERLNLSEVTIREHARRHNISLAVYRPQWEDKHNAELVKLHQQGLTQAVIGQQIGRTPGAVRKQIAKLRKEGKI